MFISINLKMYLFLEALVPMISLILSVEMYNEAIRMEIFLNLMSIFINSISQKRRLIILSHLFRRKIFKLENGRLSIQNRGRIIS